jgi:hypothetical protein
MPTQAQQAKEMTCPQQLSTASQVAEPFIGLHENQPSSHKVSAATAPLFPQHLNGAFICF